MKTNILIIIGILLFLFSKDAIAQTQIDTLEEVYSIDWLKNNCVGIEFDSTIDCDIQHFEFMDSIDNHNYYFAQYLFEKNEDDPGYDSSDDSQNFHSVGMAIFESSDNSNLRPIWTYFTEIPAFIDEPLIEMTKYGCIIHPNINLGGNHGMGDDDTYYIRKNNHWYHLNNPNYSKAFESKLPKDHQVWFVNGIIDLKSMTNSCGVYKPNDAACCPSGGEIIAYVEVQRFNIVIKKVIYKKKSLENK